MSSSEAQASSLDKALVLGGGDLCAGSRGGKTVVALGVTVNTFNTPGVMGHCHFLKVMEDAQKIRKSVIDYFEKASPPNLSEEERRKILHFVIIGGGPTRVEFAVELHDFLVEDLVKLYPAIEEFVKITIMQSGEHTMRVERSCSNNLSFGQDDQGVAKL
nr:external alternative NAD(P)H-ubiquinone oxidoreductase B1, mitochondrial [Aegilops tauschii subsp. strangulata]